MRWPAICLLLSALWAAQFHSRAETVKTPTPTETGTTIKSNTRLVVVDVLATDSSGQPVHGLTAQDFNLLEDGKVQKVRFFEEQTPDRKAPPRVALHLPPNVYTNYVTATAPGAINILLFDTLNTDRARLTFAKRQLLEYLKGMPPNSRVALYSLGSALRVVHSFTEDSQELVAAARQLLAGPHPAYTDNRQFSETIGEMKESGLGHSPKAFRAMAGFLADSQDAQVESRSLMTLQALNQLARSVAVVPGRKNLIWISGGFPFDPVSNASQVQRTSALLAASQIAVYPIDVRGVAITEADGATRDSEIFRSTESYGTSSGQDQEILDVHQAMSEMATLTGGKAYFNKNDLGAAISDGVASGSSYYTLAYRPENENWNGKFRKLAVKTSRPNVKLLHRSGYYGVLDPTNTKDDPSLALSLAMQPEVPPSTLLIMKARVIPPAEPDKPSQIDYLVDMHDLALKPAENNRQAPSVDFVTMAWDMKGKESGTISASFRQSLTPEQLATLLRTGLQLHQELMLKPGTYQLRLGVMDRLSGRVGTLDIPLTVAASIAQK
jgi:VWFA-related protein